MLPYNIGKTLSSYVQPLQNYDDSDYEPCSPRGNMALTVGGHELAAIRWKRWLAATLAKLELADRTNRTVAPIISSISAGNAA